MRSKLLIAFLLVALVAQFAPVPFAFAADEVLFDTQVNIGYWDIWLHADGVTWQYTGRPGDVINYEFDIIPPDQAEKYENVRYEMVTGITKEQFMQAGGRNDFSPDEGGWQEFENDVLKYLPDGYGKTGNNQVTFQLSPKTKAEILKKDWQAELVEGWRWYLPVTVFWYGTPAGYKLTMLKTGQGTTTPAEGTHIYPANERVELSAFPDPGWEFVRWEGDVSGTNPKAQVVMDSDKKVRAVFEKARHTLTIKVSPSMGGTTNPAPGVHSYAHGTDVSVKAIANEYWEFSHWSANAEGTNPNINVLIDRDKVIVAHFKQDVPEPSKPGDPGGMGDPKLVK